MSARIAKLAILAVFVAGAAGSAAGEELFKSKQITPLPSEYPAGIEGPAVDASGNLYVVNFVNRGTIGRLKPGATHSELYATLDDGSIGNGIRFDREGRMYIADFKRHKILVIEPGQEPGHAVARLYFKPSPHFTQPNDLAVAADGTLYASDPDFGGRTGRIWRIRRGPDGMGRGEVMSSTRRMGVTNGLDLSPDGTTLYVSESFKREIWAYRIQGAKLIATPHPIKTFPGPNGSDVDGLRTDVDGRIFVARPGAGVVAIFKPDGSSLPDVPLLGKDPTNLTFGGSDGKTIFVTQVDGGFIESFRVARPGREPCLQVPAAC